MITITIVIRTTHELITNNENQDHVVSTVENQATKEVCWDIHGKPLDWKPNKGTGDRRGKAY